MSDKSFYSEAKKVIAVDFFPKPNKNKHSYTSLNPFKHFLKKKELITPAETAEMLSVRNRSSKINLRISKMDLVDAGVLKPQRPQAALRVPDGEAVPEIVAEKIVEKLASGDPMHYPNETISVDNIELSVRPYNKDEQLAKDGEAKGKDDEKGKNGNEGNL